MHIFWGPACTFITVLAISLLTGCAAVPYEFGQDLETPLTLELQSNESQVERGRPIGFIDGLGHYFLSLPSKLLLLSWRVDNHNISTGTEEALKQYLDENDLHNVKVRLNQYSPGSEWRRLFRNREMPGFFRYTLGIFANSFYTIFPGRAFGGDNYNPYTNTINLYSDSKAIALHEGAHAKDYALKSRGFKGWYAFLRLLPLTPLYQEAVASGDAIGFFKEEKQTEREKDGYKILYPAYMTYISGEGLRWIPLEPWISYGITLGFTVPGHITGRIKAGLVEEDKQAPPASAPIHYSYVIHDPNFLLPKDDVPLFD